MSKASSGTLTVIELIQRLQQFPPTMPVSVTDGYLCQVYDRLNGCTVEVFTEGDGVEWCDIGIGGCGHPTPEDRP